MEKIERKFDKGEGRKTMITKKTINGEEYLRISDVAALSGVNIRTLQRWINNGELINFLTIYQSKNGINYFRLGEPYDYDIPIDNTPIVDGRPLKYKLPVETSDHV